MASEIFTDFGGRFVTIIGGFGYSWHPGEGGASKK